MEGGVGSWSAYHAYRKTNFKDVLGVEEDTFMGSDGLLYTVKPESEAAMEGRRRRRRNYRKRRRERKRQEAQNKEK